MKNSYANTPAFTIVELLIVIVVIGILAMISLVAYNGITNSAYDAAIKSDFTNFIKKYETIRVLDESNQYPTPTAAMGFSFSKSAYMTGRNNMYLCINSDRSQYAISAQSRSGKNFRYSTLTGTIETPNDVGYDLTCIAAGTTSSAASFSASAYYTTTGWASWAH